MGKHLWAKDSDDKSRTKQPGCIWGLAHVFGHHHKYGALTHDKWSPGMNSDSGYGYEKLLDEQESPHHGAKTARGSKKRSLRSRIKAIISEGGDDKGNGMEDGLPTKSRLQKTYSIHHLESVDDFFGKIRTDWNNPIIFFPRNAENAQKKAADSLEDSVHISKDAAELDSKEKTDVYDIFKVDKEVLLRNLQDSNKRIANFSNTKGKFSKSRSFPVADPAERKRLKPLKLESKHNEVWSSRAFDDEDGKRDIIKKHTHLRSSSLNESLNKYARLYGNNLAKDAKLSSSQSLKLASEYGNAPLYFKRGRSLSIDSYYSDINVKIFGDNDNPSSASLVVIEEYSSLDPQNNEEEEVGKLVTNDVEIKEDETRLRLHPSNDKDENQESDSLLEKDGDCSNIDLKEVRDSGFVSNSDILLQDEETPLVEMHISQGMEHNSRIHKLDSLINVDDQDLEIYDKNEESTHPCKKTTDLDYVKHLLIKSGITTYASEMTWHTSDQLLSPNLFEEIESGWPHEEGRLDGWPDFEGCWHHQMVFDLVNEVLLEVYDISVPYYPKALNSSSCVRRFPTGDRIVGEVCERVGALMELESEEFIDRVVDRDLGQDRRWMNLQPESESIGLYLEDVIFDELLQELVFS